NAGGRRKTVRSGVSMKWSPRPSRSCPSGRSPVLNPVHRMRPLNSNNRHNQSLSFNWGKKRGTRTVISAAAELPVLPGENSDRLQGCRSAEELSHRTGPDRPAADFRELHAAPAGADGRHQTSTNDRHGGLRRGAVRRPAGISDLV